MPKDIIIVAYSYDWNEQFRVFDDFAQLDEWIRQEFTISKDIMPFCRTYWEMVSEAYNDDDWKSLQILFVNGDKMEVSEFRSVSQTLTRKPSDLRSALGQLLDQVEQMKGLFPDEDGSIARAIEDAEQALKETECPSSGSP